MTTHCNMSSFLMGVMKITNVDINPLGEHDKADAWPDETGKKIPFTPGGVIKGGSTLEPEREQETSFRGMSKWVRERKVLKEQVKALYNVLSEETGQTLEVFHFDNFKYIDRKLYHKGKSVSLNN